jgi:DNA polymerase V
MTNKRGGSRLGAGRKAGSGKFGTSTTVIRVPLNDKAAVLNFLSAKHDKLSAESLDNVVALFEAAEHDKRHTLPLYTSKVAAGFPATADDHVAQRLNPSDYLVANDSSTFFVRVRGESMIDAGIFDGDVLVVDRSRGAQVGDIVLAILDTEFTVKTLGRSKNGVRLIPANANYPIIEVSEAQSFEIWGVVTGSMRKFK